MKRATAFFLVLTSFALIQCKDNSTADSIDGPVGPDKLKSFQTCTQDSDCVYAQNGCCDCANGGEDIAINKAYLQEFQDSFHCDGVPCTLKGAVPACGSGQVLCSTGRCIYMSPQIQ